MDDLIMYDDILVPTDGSEGTKETLAHALELAGLTGARLHALYVVDTAVATTMPEAEWSNVQELLEEAGEHTLGRVIEQATDYDVEIAPVTRRGTPHEEILAYADDQGIDLVLMGTHGRSGLDRMLLGSVTEKVIRQSPVPVLVTRINRSAGGDPP